VYRFAPAASRHVATTRRDGVDARIVTRERARCVRSELDSKNHCEMGISSMSDYSCTTQVGALDSICSDAAEPSRDISPARFRLEKFLCATWSNERIRRVSDTRIEAKSARIGVCRFGETTVWNTLTSRLTPSKGCRSHRFPTIGGPRERSREARATAFRDLRRARASRDERVRDRASP
jgi:hypothetical protein